MRSHAGRNLSGDETMRAFLLAVIAAVVLATGTSFFLEGIQETTEVANVTSGARPTPD